MLTTEMSLETQLLNVRHRLGQHLTQQYLNRLLDNINESDHTRVVLQAVIMILGYNYMSDRSLYIVFSKKSTIKRIKTWNKCKLHKRKICKIKNWMEFRPETFGEVSGYKGDKLLHALRDWCLIMVANRKPITKQIATSEQQTQSSVSPKIKSTGSALKRKAIKANESISLIGKSNDDKQTNKVIKNISNKSETLTNIRGTLANTQKQKKIKINKNLSKEVQVNTKSAVHDKCIDANKEQMNVGIQTEKYTESKSMKTVASIKNNISKVNGFRNKLEDIMGVLSNAKMELNEAKQDLGKLKQNDEDKWTRQREYILKKIVDDQTRLQDRLKINQSTFAQ